MPLAAATGLGRSPPLAEQRRTRASGNDRRRRLTPSLSPVCESARWPDHWVRAGLIVSRRASGPYPRDPYATNAIAAAPPSRTIELSPLQSSAVSSQDCGSDRAERGNRIREIGRSRTSGRSRADASIRGDASARGRDQSDSQRMALVARRGSGRTGDRRCFCPQPAARTLAALLLLWSLQHPGIWLALGASSSAVERSRARARLPRDVGQPSPTPRCSCGEQSRSRDSASGLSVQQRNRPCPLHRRLSHRGRWSKTVGAGTPRRRYSKQCTAPEPVAGRAHCGFVRRQ